MITTELWRALSDEPRWVWVCTECGSPAVQVTAWEYANGGAPGGDDEPTESVWCDACEVDDVSMLQVDVESGRRVTWDPERRGNVVAKRPARPISGPEHLEERRAAWFASLAAS